MGFLANFTGESGARRAQKRQQQQFDAAANSDVLANAQNDQLQQGMVKDMAAGKNAAIDENQYQQTLKDTVTPEVNSGFGGNMWSTARQKALQTGALQLRNDMTGQANQQRAGALATLRGATQNKQNVLAQKAGAIQNTSQGWMNTIGQGMNMGMNAVAAYKAGK